MQGLDDGLAEWLRALGGTGARRDQAPVRQHDPPAEGSCAARTGKLERFRGESRFTTWACKFVILEVSTKIGRHFWQRPAITLDAEDWDRLPDRFGMGSADQAGWHGLISALRRAIEEDLTERQRRVFAAIVLDDVPLGGRARFRQERDLQDNVRRPA